MSFAETESVNLVCQFTSGKWDDEESSKAELDRRLELCSDLFLVYPEVRGQYLQPRYLADEKQPRIDRLLIPKARLLEAGWKHGVVGVECKCSGKKLGPVVAQCQDYGRAVFKTPRSFVSVTCEWVFIWPVDDVVGDLASVMTQNRIGFASGPSYSLLKFKTGCGNLLEVSKDGTPRVGDVKAGCKTGSR